MILELTPRLPPLWFWQEGVIQYEMGVVDEQSRAVRCGGRSEGRDGQGMASVRWDQNGVGAKVSSRKE